MLLQTPQGCRLVCAGQRLQVLGNVQHLGVGRLHAQVTAVRAARLACWLGAVGAGLFGHGVQALVQLCDETDGSLGGGFGGVGGLAGGDGAGDIGGGTLHGIGLRCPQGPPGRAAHAGDGLQKGRLLGLGQR